MTDTAALIERLKRWFAYEDCGPAGSLRDDLKDAADALSRPTAPAPEEIAGLLRRAKDHPKRAYLVHEMDAALRKLAAEVEELKAVRDAQADELKEVDQLDCSKRIRELEAEQLKMGALRHQLEICENERAKYRAERDDWKQCAEVEAKVRREFNEMLKKAESEREQHLADMHGMQDGSLLRDTRAENERLRAERDRLQKWNELRAQDIITLGQKVGELEAERDAIRAKTIEDCAKEAEWFGNVLHYTAADVAARIRALAETESEEK